jgi:hypothetical protein
LRSTCRRVVPVTLARRPCSSRGSRRDVLVLRVVPAVRHVLGADDR